MSHYRFCSGILGFVEPYRWNRECVSGHGGHVRRGPRRLQRKPPLNMKETVFTNTSDIWQSTTLNTSCFVVSISTPPSPSMSTRLPTLLHNQLGSKLSASGLLLTSGCCPLPILLRRVVPRRACRSPFQLPKRTFPVQPSAPYSTMSASHIEYGYVEDVEALSDYRPGGYHPIQIGDVLHESYRIVHKLGHGIFSTAWLALDSQTSTYVAIKVGTADADSREVDILSQLTTGVVATSDGFSHAAEKAAIIPLVLDRFTLEGPNGTHPCFVTLPARCSLMDAKEAPGPRLFQLDVARALAAQLAMAVSIVHSHGYAHGGT